MRGQIAGVKTPGSNFRNLTSDLGSLRSCRGKLFQLRFRRTRPESPLEYRADPGDPSHPPESEGTHPRIVANALGEASSNHSPAARRDRQSHAWYQRILFGKNLTSRLRDPSRRLASGLAHEAVSDGTRVTVESGDNAARVDADAASSLTRFAACARSLEGRYRPIGSAHEAMIHVAAINGGTDNSSR